VQCSFLYMRRSEPLQKAPQIFGPIELLEGKFTGDRAPDATLRETVVGPKIVLYNEHGGAFRSRLEESRVSVLGAAARPVWAEVKLLAKPTPMTGPSPTFTMPGTAPRLKTSSPFASSAMRGVWVSVKGDLLLLVLASLLLLGLGLGLSARAAIKMLRGPNPKPFDRSSGSMVVVVAGGEMDMFILGRRIFPFNPRRTRWLGLFRFWLMRPMLMTPGGIPAMKALGSHVWFRIGDGFSNWPGRESCVLKI